MDDQIENQCAQALNDCLYLARAHVERETGRKWAARRALAHVVGVTREAVYRWKRIPPEHCVNLESALGGRVTRYQMRPDVFGPDDERPAA